MHAPIIYGLIHDENRDLARTGLTKRLLVLAGVITLAASMQAAIYVTGDKILEEETAISVIGRLELICRKPSSKIKVSELGEYTLRYYKNCTEV